MKISNKQDLLEEIRLLHNEIADLEKQRDTIYNEIKSQREGKSIDAKEKENIEDIIYNKEKQIQVVNKHMKDAINDFYTLNERQEKQLTEMAKAITQKQEELDRSNSIKILDKNQINRKIKLDINEKISEISKLNEVIKELKYKSDEINNDKRIKEIIKREKRIQEKEDELKTRESELDQKIRRMENMRKGFNNLHNNDG